MTQANTVRNLAITSTLGAIAAVMMFAQAGQASAKSVQSCDGSNRQSVVHCCEDYVNQHGMPFWMRQSGGSCTKVVACVKRYCKIHIVVIDRNGPETHVAESKGGGRGGRGGKN